MFLKTPKSFCFKNTNYKTFYDCNLDTNALVLYFRVIPGALTLETIGQKEPVKARVTAIKSFISPGPEV
jgi:hypothetical protein